MNGWQPVHPGNFKQSLISKVYPMYSNKNTVDTLKRLCQEFGVPEKLTFDSSKEQACKGTTFMKEVRRQVIDYHISEIELHYQNSVEGVN